MTKLKYIAAAIIGLAVLAIAVALTACGTTEPSTTVAPAPASTASIGADPVIPADEPNSSEARMGETLTLTWDEFGDDYKTQYTVKSPKTYTREPGTYGSKPEHGLYLTVFVLIKQVTGHTYACSCDFAFIAKDGTVYEDTYADFKGQFPSAELKAGQKVSGIVIFDIPKAALTGGRIELRESYGAANGSWLL